MEMRDLLNIVRNFKENKNIISDRNLSKNEHNNIRELIKRTKNNFLTENLIEKTLEIDQEEEERKFKEYFKDLEVIVDFIELEVFENGVFWGGTIDGIIQFVYKVTPNEKTSGYEIYYLEDFDKNNPDNEEIVNRIELYYNEFFKYWRDNLLQNNI